MAIRTTSTTVPIVADVEGDFPLTPPVGSSIALSEAHDTATMALTLIPPDRVVQSVAIQEAATLRDKLAQERTAHRLQRANAEQARRVADGLRACHTLLLEHLQQPCFQLDRNGRITHWNLALAEWTDLPSTRAVGQALTACFASESCELIEDAMRLALASAGAQEQSTSVLTLQGPLTLRSGRMATELTLIPLYHVPGVIEAYIVLVAL